MYLVIAANYIHKEIVLSLVADQTTSYTRFDAQLDKITSQRPCETNKQMKPAILHHFPHFCSIHPPARAAVPGHVWKSSSGCIQRHNQWCITEGPSSTSRWLPSLHWHSVGISEPLPGVLRPSVRSPSALPPLVSTESLELLSFWKRTAAVEYKEERIYMHVSTLKH